MRVGLFFGSFNPIHIGHLIIAQSMIDGTDIEEVWFIVSPQNPFKSSKQLLHEFDRYEMVYLAIKDNDRFKVSDIEFQMPKPSYTIDTLTYLTEKHPNNDFVLIIGSDNLTSFHKWKNHKAILKHYGLLVYPRPGTTDSEISGHPNVKQVEAPLLDISATFIRKKIRQQKSVKYLVPDAVLTCIDDRKFYQ